MSDELRITCEIDASSHWLDMCNLDGVKSARFHDVDTCSQVSSQGCVGLYALIEFDDGSVFTANDLHGWW